MSERRCVKCGVLFSTAILGAGEKKKTKVTSCLSKYLLGFFFFFFKKVYRWNTFGSEIAVNAGLQSQPRQFHRRCLVSLRSLTSGPAKPKLTTTWANDIWYSLKGSRVCNLNVSIYESVQLCGWWWCWICSFIYKLAWCYKSYVFVPGQGADFLESLFW